MHSVAGGGHSHSHNTHVQVCLLIFDNNSITKKEIPLMKEMLRVGMSKDALVCQKYQMT